MLIFLPSLGIGQEQEELKNDISLSWGVGNLVKQDITFSPLIHGDWSPVNFLFTYERSNQLEHKVNVRYGNYKSRVGEEFIYNTPWSSQSYPTSPHNINVAAINYSLGKSVIERDQFKLILGGTSRNRFDITDYIYGFNGTAGNYLSLGLDFWVNLKYKISEKHRLKVNLSVPIFAFVYRSPYLTQNDEYFEDIYSHNDVKGFFLYFKRGEIQSWNNSQNFDFDINYYYALTEKWELGANYWFSINTNKKPTKYASIENVLYLSANYKF
ncbi:hypothetical protein K6119_09845 [Paracrocinitomix mangrovi]|uniref:hypothetical protein n=1 Tax=Paracrocinitomix mangrovi TaxID=2862509 RepID=UPI001C8E5FA9|nr:hypothetical protein [Paracrocinitomix mangrovi]UKN03792.1 hypothetical protein K6119_09845 [Paracrocinitomix mangrovi]